ncbi:MAG TPA: ABC transporter permease [Candidatus Atribacteria bacterium]|nr:ABC transporter permease [Candidatus Atribacteria bacterium]
MNILSYYFTNLGKIMYALEIHIFIFLVSLTFSIIIGIAISIFITQEDKKKVGRLILSVTGAAQSVPSLVIIALIFIFVGIGIRPAIIALIIYGLVPIIFNTTSGILSVGQEIIEAGKGMGLTQNQLLWKVKIPIALPVIMGGIRSSATIIIGSTTVAAVIGGGGLGDFIFIGLKMQKPEMLISGALTVSLLAIIVDYIMAIIEKKVVPRGLQIKKI